MNLGNLNNKKIIFIFIIFFLFSSKLYGANLEGDAVTLGALDKITAKFSEFNINVGDTDKFGSLSIEIFKCIKRPPEEIPEDFVLLKIFDEINTDEPKLIFSGWMLSSSRSLSSLEHPTYDIWIKDCKAM